MRKSKSRRRVCVNSKTHQNALGTTQRSKTAPESKRSRRVSLRANAAATLALYTEAEILTASRQDKHTVLKLASARLDDVELDTALKAALRGDYTVASDRLHRTINQTHMHSRVLRPKGWSPWRNAILPRRIK
jgi:hypothetical protein